MPSSWRARSTSLAASMSWACAPGIVTAGTIVDQQQAQVATREEVLNALSQIARTLRTRIGESQATVEQHSRPLVQATTPSLEALKALQHRIKGGPDLRQFRRHTFLPARDRHRSEVRDGPRESGTLVQQCWRVSAVSAEHNPGLAIARSRQRSGTVLHRLHLQPPGHRQSGKSLPDIRVVAADVSRRRRRSPKPRGSIGRTGPSRDRPIRESDRRITETTREGTWQHLQLPESCVQLHVPRQVL